MKGDEREKRGNEKRGVEGKETRRQERGAEGGKGRKGKMGRGSKGKELWEERVAKREGREPERGKSSRRNNVEREAGSIMREVQVTEKAPLC